MSHAVPPVQTISEAWLKCLEAVVGGHASGRMVHVVSTITEPGSEINGIRAALETFLAKEGLPEIDTVAETIFPRSLISEPAHRWSPSLSPREEAPILRRERELFAAYSDMLEMLLSADGNRSGTYFSRMITWPGKAVGGVNQIADRISSLRSQLRNGRSTYNAMDIDLAADALNESTTTADQLRGLELYSVTDRRNRGFPCLTHVDLTLFESRLHMTAVYRHQYLVSKAYGNLLGLSWLLQFIADQAGVDAGELVIHATMADGEFNELGRQQVLTLVKSAREESNAQGQRTR
jgi:hypothetical protein